MDLALIITAVAFLLMAIGISSKGTGVWSMLAGMGLVVVAIILRVVSGGGIFETLFTLLWNVGLGLLVAAVWLGIRKVGTDARSFMLLGLGALVLAGLLYGASRLWNAAWSTEQQSVLVELGPDDQIEELAALLTTFDVISERAFPTVTLEASEDLAQVYLLHTSSRRIPRLMDALRADSENVDYVELNVNVHLSPVESHSLQSEVASVIKEDDPLASEQWALEAIAGHEAHAVLQDHSPVRKARVAILDTGVEAGHEDLAPVYDAGVQTDIHGHGTHCAGLAGAATNNRVGIASLNWEGRFIELLGFQALGHEGRGSLEQIAQAIVDATQADVDVISMSLGSTAETPPRVLTTAVQFALDQDIIVVAAAGNSNTDAIEHYPSNIEGVIAVAAVDPALAKAKFSNTVARLSRPIAAPGVEVLSSYLDGTYKPMSGTSMATPIVTGLLGVMRALNPSLTAAQAYDILQNTGTEVADTPQIGRVINAEAAVRATLAMP